VRNLLNKLKKTDKQEGDSITNREPSTVSDKVDVEQDPAMDNKRTLDDTVELARVEPVVEEATIVVEENSSPVNVEIEDEAAVIDEKGEESLKIEETKLATTLIEDTVITLPAKTQEEVRGLTRRLKVSQQCHLGNVRSRNEDSILVFNTFSGGQEPLFPFGLYIVADGMGGHHAGHEASKQVSRLVAEYVLERIYLPLLHSKNDSPALPQEPIRDVLLEAVQKANTDIYRPEPEKGSGTTLTAALVFGQRLYIAHVGDSRAYVLANGDLEQVTTDHSYVRRLQDVGQLTEEEAAIHPQRNMLYKAVGQGGQLDIDTFTKSLPKAGVLVLCSDGLWGLVSDPMIQDIVESEGSLEDKAVELVNMALEAGGHDNISVILVDFQF
jgi:serine/threonine protein phosphatase PrpC